MKIYVLTLTSVPKKLIPATRIPHVPIPREALLVLVEVATLVMGLRVTWTSALPVFTVVEMMQTAPIQ